MVQRSDDIGPAFQLDLADTFDVQRGVDRGFGHLHAEPSTLMHVGTQTLFCGTAGRLGFWSAGQQIKLCFDLVTQDLSSLHGQPVGDWPAVVIAEVGFDHRQ